MCWLVFKRGKWTNRLVIDQRWWLVTSNIDEPRVRTSLVLFNVIFVSANENLELFKACNSFSRRFCNSRLNHVKRNILGRYSMVDTLLLVYCRLMRAKYVLYKEFEALSGWILIYAFVQLIQMKYVESLIYLKFNSQKELILPGVMHHPSKCLVCNTPSFFGIGGQKNSASGASLCVW